MLILNNAVCANPFGDPFSLSINTSSLLEPCINEGATSGIWFALLQISSLSEIGVTSLALIDCPVSGEIFHKALKHIGINFRTHLTRSLDAVVSLFLFLVSHIHFLNNFFTYT